MELDGPGAAKSGSDDPVSSFSLDSLGECWETDSPSTSEGYNLF
jgi:hypothetical protein